MFLYLLLKRSILEDMKAAVELLKEVYSADLRGFGHGLGLVYATRKPVSENDKDTLGLVGWE